MKRLLSLGLLLSLVMFLRPVQAAVFTDVASNHPNYDAINYLQENGIVEGYSDNTFRPNQLVNRAEALKIILLGSAIFVPDIAPQEIFPDVMHEAWYGKFVLKAKNLTIVSGDGDTGLFRPGDTMNLAEALKILLKTNNNDGIPTTIHPYNDVAPNTWFAPYFEYASQADLLDQSSSENVYPATPVSRALLAELMYRLATNDFIMADGLASYYGEKFHGRTTANGEIFDASLFTAAHRTYPFDTWLRVTNVANGQSTVVRVNDRGPYADTEHRIIDLSKAAFESISPLGAGVISVKIEETYAPSLPASTSEPTVEASEEPTVSLADLLSADLLNTSKSSCPEADSLTYITKTTYDSITLDKEIPNRVLADELLTLRGISSSSNDQVSAFLIDEDGIQTHFTSDLTDGRFEVIVRFPSTGTYKLGVLPGLFGSSTVWDVIALKNTCIEEAESSALPLVSGLELDMNSGDTVVRWDKGNYNLFKLTFAQEGLHHSYILHDLSDFSPTYSEFSAFDAGNTELSLRGASLLQKSLLEPVQLVWSKPSSLPFIASTHEEYIISEDEIDLVSLTSNTIAKETIKVLFRPKTDVRVNAAVILPSGTVKEIALTSSTLQSQQSSLGFEVFPRSTSRLTAEYKTEKTGVHFLEVNNAEGLAVINVPIYIRNQYPLLPNPRDVSDGLPVDLGNDSTALNATMLDLVNLDRKDHGYGPLALDNNLSRLAQARSDDMVHDNYFGHWDKNGQTANDLRKNYGIQTTVGENLAKDINLELAQYGLMRSAIHRSNILSDDWSRVGFGISKLAEGSYIVVQIFSGEPLDLSDVDGLRNEVLEAINAHRSSDLALGVTLNNLAQTWSQKMVDEEFFDFTDGTGTGLVDTIRDANVNAALGTYIMGNSSFPNALDQIGLNEQLQDSKWKTLGVGIEQDSLGIIKITLIYTE